MRGILAKHLKQQGSIDDGEAILLEATELQNSPAAWLALAEFRREVGRHEAALEALEKALELVPGVTDYLRFKHAGMLADAGQLDRAAEAANEISDPLYRDLVAGRVAYEQNDPKRALELLDSGLRQWPNNGGARYLAGKAAIALGDVGRGTSEFREALRVDPAGTDAGLELARMQLAQHRHRAALNTLTMMSRDGRKPPPDRWRNVVVLTARALAAGGQHEAAGKTLDELAKSDPVLAAVERAGIVAEAEGPEAAIQAIEKSGLDLTQPSSEPALRALCQQLFDAGRGSEALERAEAALAAHPDTALLHDLQGRLLVNAGRKDEARAALEQAIELDPDLAGALAALGEFAASEGDQAQARALFDRAAAAAPGEPAYPYRGAQLRLAEGLTAEAVVLLRETLARDPLYAEANNDLAWLTAESGEDPDLALELARRAERVQESATILDTLGWVYIKRGEYDEAAEALERARELDPQSPSIAYRLSLALVETGGDERARALLREALGRGAFPEAEQAQQQLDRLASAGS
jgi:tetratricopeptide (TPR) repeat protein